MKWRAIRNPGCEEAYAWESDEKGYSISLAYVNGERKYRAWFKLEPLHRGTFDTPKAAQELCEKHFAEKSHGQVNE